MSNTGKHPGISDMPRRGFKCTPRPCREGRSWWSLVVRVSGEGGSEGGESPNDQSVGGRSVNGGRWSVTEADRSFLRSLLDICLIFAHLRSLNYARQRVNQSPVDSSTNAPKLGA